MLVATLGDIWARLQEADPVDKAEVYRHLGLRPTYKPQEKLVEVKVEPAVYGGKSCRRGDFNHSPMDGAALRTPRGLGRGGR